MVAVVAGAAHIRVAGHRRSGVAIPTLRVGALPVQPTGQDRLDAAVVGCADGPHADAGGLQPVIAVLAGQAPLAEASAVAVLEVRAALHLPAHQWPLVIKDIQDRCLQRLTARGRFNEGQPQELATKLVGQFHTEHA